MNPFLKTVLGAAYIAAHMKSAYAAEPVLASKNACTDKAGCISDLADYMNTYDGLTEIRDLGGPIETAQQFVYGNPKDWSVTRAEAVDPAVRFVFPSSRPELYYFEGYTSQVGSADVFDPADVLRMKIDYAREFTKKRGAPSCTEIGSIPLRTRTPLTAEEIRNGSLYGGFGGCYFQTLYDAAIRRAIEEGFQPYDINNDGVISKADDRNNDNMITLEDAVLLK